MDAVGIVLAAGAGTRIGSPKALVRDTHDVLLLERAIRALSDGGCARVVVVLGAEADAALRSAETGEYGRRAEFVVAEDWSKGMGASLRVGLAQVRQEDAALIHLVDLPDVGPDVVARMLSGVTRATLARATYDGEPGHPVVAGHDHLAALLNGIGGEAGARDFLRRSGAVLVECGDLATGRDVDTRGDLDALA